MRKSGEHDVLELGELGADGGVDRRVAVPEQINPPRAYRIEIAPPVEIVEPRPVGAGDRHQRQRLVQLHLRARMPDGGVAAREPCGVTR